MNLAIEWEDTNCAKRDYQRGKRSCSQENIFLPIGSTKRGICAAWYVTPNAVCKKCWANSSLFWLWMANLPKKDQTTIITVASEPRFDGERNPSNANTIVRKWSIKKPGSLAENSAYQESQKPLHTTGNHFRPWPQARADTWVDGRLRQRQASNPSPPAHPPVINVNVRLTWAYSQRLTLKSIAL